MADGDATEELMPFGVELSLAVFDRATLVARGLFPGSDSVVILVKDGKAWRSRHESDALPPKDLAAERVIATGEMIWIEDALAEPLFADNPLVVGPPYLRAYIGAPIRLEDGATPGVLAVVSTAPIPHDTAKAAQLQALADFVADEWNRAHVAHERNRSAQELNAARATQATLLGLVPMSMVVMDTEMRVVAASKVWEQHLNLEGTDYVGRTVFDISPQVYEPFRKSMIYALRGNHLSNKRVRVDRHNDTGHMWMQTEVLPWRDASGEVGGLMILADDVTEMVEALENFERTEQRLGAYCGRFPWEINSWRRA